MEQNLKDENNNEVPPLVPRNRVPIEFCIKDEWIVCGQGFGVVACINFVQEGNQILKAHPDIPYR
jgi:hypothetical protein